MPAIGTQCDELRINDTNRMWRVMYRVEPDAVVILDVFDKKTAATPHGVGDVPQTLGGVSDRGSQEGVGR